MVQLAVQLALSVTRAPTPLPLPRRESFTRQRRRLPLVPRRAELAVAATVLAAAVCSIAVILFHRGLQPSFPRPQQRPVNQMSGWTVATAMRGGRLMRRR